MVRSIFSLLTLIVCISASAADFQTDAETALLAGDTEAALEAYLGLLGEDPANSEALDIALLLAGEVGLAEMGMGLLVDDVERLVAAGDLPQVQIQLRRLTELGMALPSWVGEAQAAGFHVDEVQMAEFEFWDEMNLESQALMDTGDFESAAIVLEGTLMFAEDSFGESHGITIATLRDLGYSAAQQGDGDAADAYYNQALGLSANVLGESHPETQHIAGLTAELYSAAGMGDEALMMRNLITANYAAEFGDAHSLTLEAQLMEVRTFEEAGDYVAAVSLLEQTCATYRANYSRYHPESVDCQLNLARFAKETGSLDEAEAILGAVVIDLAASSPTIDEMSLGALMQLAEIYRERGEYQASKELLSGVIATAQQIGATDTSYTGKAYLARLLTNEGETANAEKLTLSILDYGRQAWTDQPVQYYNVFLELGAIYQRQGRFPEAEAIFEESMQVLLEVVGEAYPSTLVAMNNLGNVYEQQGLFDKAEPILKQALSGMESSFGEAHPQTARTRNNLALLHESQGNFREAEPLYISSYEYLSRELGENHPNAIGFQNNLAFLYMMLEEYDSAATIFEDIVERWNIVLGPDHQDALKSLNNLGRVYWRQGRLEEAEQKILQALAARTRTLGESHIDSIRSLIDLGAIYLDQNRLNEASLELRKALKFAEAEIGEQHPYTFEALNNLARVVEAQGDLSQAIELREIGFNRRSEFLDRMLWVTGENARDGYIRLHKPERDDYLALLTRVDDPLRGKKMLNASLQRKGLLLKITSEIEQLSQLSKDPKLAALSEELEDSRKRLASLTLSGPTIETAGRHSEALYALERRVNELQGELGRVSVRYRSSIAGVSADKLEAVLHEGTALVDFLMFQDNGQAKVIAAVMQKTDGDVSYQLIEYPDREKLEAVVVEYREIIQDDSADEDEILDVGQLGYEIIWNPIEAATGGIEYVYLVPDGVLNILPFNALSNADGEYLIQTTDLHILTSGRDLLPSEYKLAEGEYIILAGPDYNSEKVVGSAELAEAEGRRSSAIKLGIRGAAGGLRGLNFAPLPGAEKEGRIITEQIQANEEKSQVFFGEFAQEQVLSNMEAAPEILHIATHGFFLAPDASLRKRLLKMQRGSEQQVPPPGDNPLLRAGLAFAGINSNAQFLGDIDTENDGVLTALEVLSLNLSGTRLVVLSACETGLGEIHEGEGVYGLRRSFQEAGVAEVISSLWEVSDAGTQALMTDFYERVLDGVPAREAMRDTQLAMIDSPEWGYPYIWSAFMMVGSYESAGISVQ